jgi:hypothetical protein
MGFISNDSLSQKAQLLVQRKEQYSREERDKKNRET